MNKILYSLTAAMICGILAMAGCRQSDKDFGAGQKASQAELQQQNQNLIAQLVLAAEELEQHSDPAYLQNALSRLNSWLSDHAASRDFQPIEEFAALSASFAEISQASAKVSQELTAYLDAERKPEAGEGDQLAADLGAFAALLREPGERFRSKIMLTYAELSTAMQKSLAGGKEFQFGDQEELMRTSLRKIQIPGWVNFNRFSESMMELSRLYQLDRRDFRPEDTFHLQEMVWQRNVLNWVKGDEQDDLAVAVRLFDWTCEEVTLTEKGPQGPAGEIRKMPWEAILTSQGTGLDRAAVFMGLLRQYRIDSFLIVPAVRPEGQPQGIPAVVAVLIDNRPYLFLPDLGLPVPAAGGLSFSQEGKQGLRFDKIATLDEAAADDSLWRQFDLSETERFPLCADDFKSINVRIPIGPFDASERMRIMEQEFSSNTYTVLAASYSMLKEKAAALPNAAAVEPAWVLQTAALEQTILPDETAAMIGPYLYTMEAGKDLATEASDSKEKTPEGAETGNEYTSILHNAGTSISPLWGGKILYFAGRFTGENGAAYWIQQGNTPDRLIKQMADQMQGQMIQYVEQMRKQASEEGKTLSQEELSAMAMQFMQVGQQDLVYKLFIKSAVRFDLALVSRGIGNSESALDHLKNQLQNGMVAGQFGQVWQAPALLMMARIYEETGRFAESVPIYRNMQGAAGWGARIRGKWLAELAGIAAPVQEPKEEPAAPAEPEPAVTEAASEPAPSEPAENQPAESQPVESQPVENQAAETPAENQPAAENPINDAPAEAPQP